MRWAGRHTQCCRRVEDCWPLGQWAAASWSVQTAQPARCSARCCLRRSSAVLHMLQRPSAWGLALASAWTCNHHRLCHYRIRISAFNAVIHVGSALLQFH